MMTGQQQATNWRKLGRQQRPPWTLNPLKSGLTDLGMSHEREQTLLYSVLKGRVPIVCLPIPEAALWRFIRL